MKSGATVQGLKPNNIEIKQVRIYACFVLINLRQQENIPVECVPPHH